jgi:hypothetical protein
MDQDVDIAIRSKIVSNLGAEEGELTNSSAPAEISNILLGISIAAITAGPGPESDYTDEGGNLSNSPPQHPRRRTMGRAIVVIHRQSQASIWARMCTLSY